MCYKSDINIYSYIYVKTYNLLNYIKMKGFKQCPKGHFYKEDKDTCPYCPNSNTSDVLETEHFSNSNDRTNVDTLKTQVFGGAAAS